MSSFKKNKFIFGSAGFGSPEYGFSSENKPTSHGSYLKSIHNLNIRHIDTAPSYGHSERTIGMYHENNSNKFGMWTKVDGLSKNSQFTVDKIHESAQKSLNNLNVESLKCLYLHQNDIEIIEDKFVQKGLKEIKESGVSKKTGVSIYNSVELERALSLEVYDVVQLPVSAANTHLYNIAKKKSHDKIIVGRSIFLQGSLLNIESKANKFNYFTEILHVVKSLQELAYSYNIDYLSMLLLYINSLENLDYIIISSKNEHNIKKILNYSETLLNEEIKNTIDKISKNENDWTNPRNWIF